MIDEKFLPIGTIINIKNNKNKYMIAGYATIQMNDVPRYYDYITYQYPYGMLRSDKVLLINAPDVEKVIAYGLADEEQKAYVNKLNSFLTEEKKTELMQKMYDTKGE